MLPPKPTEEEIKQARELIYYHISNEDIRVVLFRALDNAEYNWNPKD